VGCWEVINWIIETKNKKNILDYTPVDPFP
jgi:hypothetical protein